MKNNILKIVIAAISVLTAIMIFFEVKLLMVQEKDMGNMGRNEIVALNEIEKLATANYVTENTPEIKQAISHLQNELREQSIGNKNRSIMMFILIVYLIVILFILILFGYINQVIMKPFDKLNDFAAEVANGNFESPLYYERTNLFGAFTWAFDNMRKEVMKARKCEIEAIENNKTVIATISHDIKTPIASIRAYTEGLQANMDSNQERKQRYLSVIINKCDEVSRLTNDLFLHSLSDLDKLQINCELSNAEKVVTDIIKSIQADNPHLKLLNEVPQRMISIDIRRLEQVFENLISNSVKYAKSSDIEVSFQSDDKFLTCHIRDYGEGIIEEDIPFIFEKFYRGRNTSDLPGSGLGLYIVKYIMEQMDGTVDVFNRHPGLEVIIRLPVINQNK